MAGRIAPASDDAGGAHGAPRSGGPHAVHRREVPRVSASPGRHPPATMGVTAAHEGQHVTHRREVSRASSRHPATASPATASVATAHGRRGIHRREVPRAQHVTRHRSPRLDGRHHPIKDDTSGDSAHRHIVGLPRGAPQRTSPPPRDDDTSSTVGKYRALSTSPRHRQPAAMGQLHRNPARADTPPGCRAPRHSGRHHPRTTSRGTGCSLRRPAITRPPWWVLPSLPVEVGARRGATRVRTIWTKEVERALNSCQGPVPPVGVEPTRTTLLGSLPLPVGLRGRPQSYRDSANSGPQTK